MNRFDLFIIGKCFKYFKLLSYLRAVCILESLQATCSLLCTNKGPALWNIIHRNRKLNVHWFLGLHNSWIGRIWVPLTVLENLISFSCRLALWSYSDSKILCEKGFFFFFLQAWGRWYPLRIWVRSWFSIDWPTPC